MKRFPILITLTSLFLCLTVGFFVGNNLRREPVLISIPQGMETLAPEMETFVYNPFPINLNTATREELEALPGVGEVLAFRIWCYRVERSRIARLDELYQIEGFGKETMEKIQGLVYCGG